MSSTQEVGEIFGDGSGPAQAMLRSPTVIIASIGLWGMNVYFFKLFKLDYVKILKLDLVKEQQQQEKERRQQTQQEQGTSTHNNDNNNTTENSTPPPSPTTTTMSSTITSTPPGGENLSSRISPTLSSTTTTTSTSGSVDDENEKESFLQNNNGNVDNQKKNVILDHSDHDEKQYGITWSKLIFLSLFLLVLLHLTTYVWMDLLGGGSIGAVFAFYTSVTLAIITPLKSTRWLRTATGVCLYRAYELVNPRCSCINVDRVKGPRPIPFIDVFFADAMCSLSKVFFDWGMLWHLASHYPNPVPPALDTILIPSFCAAIPYIIRARQCLIMNTVGKIKADPKRYLHLVNAVKYSTSIFPLCMSAYQQIVIVNYGKGAGSGYEPIIVTLLTINSLYALAWDIIMDWGMMQNPKAIVNVDACVPTGLVAPGSLSTLEQQQQPTTTTKAAAVPKESCAQTVLRPRLRFGICMSTVILLSDCVLRFAWTLRFFPGLFPNKDYFVLFTQFLEAFRRAIWNLLRVEWENIKQTKSSKNHDNNASGDEESTPFIRAPKSISMIQVSGGGDNGDGGGHHLN